MNENVSCPNNSIVTIPIMTHMTHDVKESLGKNIILMGQGNGKECVLISFTNNISYNLKDTHLQTLVKCVLVNIYIFRFYDVILNCSKLTLKCA